MLQQDENLLSSDLLDYLPQSPLMPLSVLFIIVVKAASQSFTNFWVVLLQL
jgi:hypothetical protein